jgi:chromosome segregation ATPase
MDWLSLVNTTITGLSIVVVILNVVSKIRWADEFAKAKNEVIRSKEAEIQVLKRQIETLEKFNPAFMRETLEHSQVLADERITQLKEEKKRAQEERDETLLRYETIEEENANLKRNLTTLESTEQVSPEKQREMAELRQEIEAQESRLSSMSLEVEKLTAYISDLVEQIRNTSAFYESTEALDRSFDHFDSLFERYIDAVREDDFAQMGTIHDKFIGSLTVLEILEQYIASYAKIMADFAPRYREYVLKLRYSIL